MDSDGGHTVLAIHRNCVHGDRRRTSASMADTDDGAVPAGLDHFPSLRIILGVDARHFDELRRHLRQERRQGRLRSVHRQVQAGVRRRRQRLQDDPPRRWSRRGHRGG